MKREELFRAIGDIDSTIVMGHSVKKEKGNSGIVRFLVSAACLMLVISGLLVIYMPKSGRGSGGETDPFIDNTGVTIVTDPFVEDSSQPTVNDPSAEEPGFTIITDPIVENPEVIEGLYIPAVLGGEGEGYIEKTVNLNEAGITTPSDEFFTDGVTVGPLMPMTFTQKNTAITAQREMLYDFSNNKEKGYTTITDKYVLSNTSGEAQEVTYLYPYTGYRQEVVKQKPSVIVNGEVKVPDIINGCYDGNNRLGWHSIYDAICETADYPALINNDTAGIVAKVDDDFLGREVLVYEYDFSKFLTPLAEDEVYLIRCKAEDAAKIYCGDMPIYYEDEDYLYVGFYDDQEWRTKLPNPMLIFTEGEPEGYQEFIGKIDDCGMIVSATEKNIEDNKYKSTIRDRMKFFADRMLKGTEFENNQEFKELYYNRVWQVLSDIQAGRKNREQSIMEGVEGYFGSDLTDIAYLNWDQYCFFLLTNTINIPAGESVTISFQYDRLGKYEQYPEEYNKGVFGYDNMINLGTNIRFSSQKAGIQEKGNIEIVEQNYGFDLLNNVRKVELNRQIENYYLYVRFLQ